MGAPQTQTTLGARTILSGVGVHGGRPVSMTLRPALAGNGISFCRTDAQDGSGWHIPADFRHVSATDLCTAVGTAGRSVATVEHLMAALTALGVDNVTVEIDGPEVPVMDGSAKSFVDAIDRVGTVGLGALRRHIRILRPVSVRLGESVAEFTPYDRMRVDVEIDFTSRVIGRQRFAADLDPATFRREIAPARTFGFLADVEALWARGLAIGASFDNVVVIGEDRVINPEGLRFADEFVRHKALDAVGDLALAGAPIMGCYRSYRGGHRLNVEAVRALMADGEAWAYEEVVERRRRPASVAAAEAVAVRAAGAR